MAKNAVRITASGLITLFSLAAQTSVDLRTQSKNVDFSGATSTKPAKTGTSLPSTCSTGEVFFRTSVPAGSNLYGCTATNTWTQLSAIELPPATAMADKVLSNDGSAPMWKSLSGDVGGAPDAIQVTGLRGRAVGTASPSDRAVLRWNSGLNQWEPSADGGSYSAGTGIQIAGNTISVEDAIMPFYYTGINAPAIGCMAGRDYYVDTVNGHLYFCKSDNVWQRTGMETHAHPAADITAGVLDNARTSGTTANIPGTLVLRGPSGEFSAGQMAGNAATATQLAADPADCGTDQYATGIQANGQAVCAQPSSAQLSDASTIVRITAAATFAAGATVTVNPSASAAALTVNPGTLPSTPREGDIAVDSSDHTLKWYDGTLWKPAGGAGGGTGTIFGTYIGSSLTAGQTQYWGALITSLSTNEATRQFLLPAACTARNLRIRTGNAQGANGALVATVRKNAADTAVVATIAAGTAGPAQADSGSGAVAFSAGDLLSIKITNNHDGGSAQITHLAVQCN